MEIVNRHQREVRASLTASYNHISIMLKENTQPFQNINETEMLHLLRSLVEPSYYTMEKLRKLLSFAIRESMGM